MGQDFRVRRAGHPPASFCRARAAGHTLAGQGTCCALDRAGPQGRARAAGQGALDRAGPQGRARVAGQGGKAGRARLGRGRQGRAYVAGHTLAVQGARGWAGRQGRAGRMWRGTLWLW
eukprot:365783-Chlamydomonas_euryale.AAC.8